MTPPVASPRPSGGFANLTAQMSAVRLAPAHTLGIRIERVVLGLVIIAGDVALSMFFAPPWWAAAALFVLALLVMAPGMIRTAIQSLIALGKDAKALRAAP